jgi:hypothetical protein
VLRAGDDRWLPDERDQWFFTLPLELRAAALELRRQGDYSKLWPAIERFNAGTACGRAATSS